MKFSLNPQKGVTLLEILLVLAIGASMLILGIQQYMIFRKDTDVRQAKMNINLIFEAAARYYYANCYGQTNPQTGQIIKGTLNPTNNPTYPFTITLADLRTQGFLSQPLLNIPFSKYPTLADNNYDVQFNHLPFEPRYACQTTNCATKKQIGVIDQWIIQVSMQLPTQPLAKTYLYALSGDCLSQKTGGIIPACPGSATGDYVLFQRQPLNAAPDVASPMRMSNPELTQFQEEYTTLDVGYLFGVNQGVGYQYFYCGS